VTVTIMEPSAVFSVAPVLYRFCVNCGGNWSLNIMMCTLAVAVLGSGRWSLTSTLNYHKEKQIRVY